MKRLILIACAALTLAACTSPPRGTDQPLSGNAGIGVVNVATLATNACEEVTAPLQTRAIVATYQARRALREGRITVAQAQAVADDAREAQAATRAACPTKDKPDPAQLDRARAAIARMAATLGEPR